MNKQDFLDRLRRGLCGLPPCDVEERVTFYDEMIDDRMEEGLSEAEAVAAVGPIEEIVQQAVADTPLTKIATERIKPKRQLKAWEIVLLVLGSPLWLSLLIAAAAVVLSLYVVLWAVIVSLWAVFGALAGTAAGGVLAGVAFLCGGNPLSGVAVIAAGAVCGGLAIFTFCGCKAATRGVATLTGRLAVWIKNRLIKKEEPQ